MLGFRADRRLASNHPQSASALRLHSGVADHVRDVLSQVLVLGCMWIRIPERSGRSLRAIEPAERPNGHQILSVLRIRPKELHHEYDVWVPRSDFKVRVPVDHLARS